MKLGKVETVCLTAGANPRYLLRTQRVGASPFVLLTAAAGICQKSDFFFFSFFETAA